MNFPESRIITAKQLAKVYKNAPDTQRFCFILGAGASVESGIVDGKELEMRWMKEIMEDRENYQDFLNTAQALLDDEVIEHPFGEIKKQWEIAKEKGERLSSEYYFDLYKLQFCLNPRDGYHALEELMEGKEPSVGYHVLAKLLTQDKKSNNLVVTTNFDSLVEDSLFVYTDKKPLVASHEALACFIDSNARRPVVAKVHRGLMFNPFNSAEEIAKLQPEWEKVLSTAFNIYSPIVIGYAGGDQSLMSFLEKDTTELQSKIYWCYREKSGLPDDKILKFVDKNKGYLVKIEGFDNLMLEIGGALFPNDISPDGTKKYLDRQLNLRMENYIKKYAEAEKKSENEDAIRPIEEAQRAGEKKREEANALTAWDHIRRGNRLSDEGKYSEAIEEHSRAIVKDPNLAPAYNNRGNAYSELEEYEKAIADFNKAIELDPKYVFAYYNRGNAYTALGKHDDAIADYTKAIELDPKYAFAYNNRGIAYDKSGKYAEAIADYTKAIELDPKDAEAYNNRGVAYYYLKDYEKAIAEYTKAIELDPKYAKAYNNRGNAYSELEEYEKAIADYNKAIELDPEYAQAYSNRGTAYGIFGKYDEAIADFNKAIELDPKDVQAYNNRGIAYRKFGKYEEAIADYIKAIELDPKYAKAYNNRAIAYRATGQIERAKADEAMAAKLENA